jgi:protein arginine kinase activator
MICGSCGEHESVVTLTQVVEGEARTIGLCGKCAAEKGVQIAAGSEPTPLGGFLSAMWKGQEPGAPAEFAPTGRCPGCGASFADFRESGRLGCGTCYRTFEPSLRLLLRRYHGSTHHHGRRPALAPEPGAAGPVETATLVASLKDQLRLAVAAEDFERAAELRDRLRELG